MPNPNNSQSGETTFKQKYSNAVEKFMGLLRAFDHALGRVLGKYAPTETEEGEHQGLLSTFAEIHSVLIGAGVGIAGGLLADPIIMSGFLLTLLGIKGGAEMQKSGQMRDAMREPAYAIVGMVIGYVLIGLFVNPEAITQLEQYQWLEIITKFAQS